MENKIIAELAGRDSFAALLKYIKENDVREVIPTIAKAPSEYGSVETVRRKFEWLRERLANKPVYIEEVKILEDHKLWWVLNGRYISEIIRCYGFYTPCLGCHLYLHLLRVNVALKEKVNKIISGEREYHQEKIKINQTSLALTAYQEVLKSINLELIFPLRKVFSNQEIENLLGIKWEESKEQLNCAFKENYCSFEGKLLINDEMLKPYLEEFLVPVGIIIAKANLNKKSDYHLEVETYLKKWASN